MLNDIKTELQNIADTIKAITNVDVTIMDRNLKRIAATGILRNNIGKFVPQNSAFHKSLTTGEQYFITNPPNHHLCLDCYNKESCEEKAELCIPIKDENNIIGVLGMCIFDEETKNNFINKHEGYKNFESRLSSLISTRINEKKLGILVEYRSSELMTLINSLNEGIIILNNNKQILSMNNYIKEKANLYGIKEHTNIKEILPNKILDRLLSKNFHGEIGIFEINQFKFILNSSPIIVKGKKKGVVLVFSDFHKMQESILKANKSSNIITFDDIIGESETLLNAKRQAIQIAEEDISVLLLGESGTGKEVFARAIHFASNRKNEAFMPINSGAIPENLIESELFGYEKGAFTGANTSGKMGKFELAKDGTVFLDEIGDLPIHMQVKLLRVLEEREIIRVGGNETIKVNPRIISATHKNLYKMVTEDKFREDLFYRLNVVPITIPPLRERAYDIIILARYFLKKYNKVYGKNLLGFTKECEKSLLNYSFPGNIRELRNLIEYSINFEKGDYITTDTLNQKLNPSNDTGKDLTLAEMTRTYEKKVLENYIKKYGDNVDAKKSIAKKLGISIATFYRKLE